MIVTIEFTQAARLRRDVDEHCGLDESFKHWKPSVMTFCKPCRMFAIEVALFGSKFCD
jgi:hypothetical protein